MFKQYRRFIATRGALLAACLLVLASFNVGSVQAATLAAVPAGLTASAGNSTITLNWAPSSGATSYNVQRSMQSGGPYFKIASVTSPTYFDILVRNGTAYYYEISAVNAAGVSANSAEVFATPSTTATATPPPASPTVAAVPTGLAATAGSGSVTLTWSASSGATSYYVLRATQHGGPYTRIASPTSPTYLDGAVTNGTAYYYVVAAVNAVGSSSNSAEVSATPTAAATAGPSAGLAAVPAGLTASAGNSTITLNWAASSGATSYNVQRAMQGGGPYFKIASVTSPAYFDLLVRNGTAYYYEVSAVNATGVSANSAYAFATPSATATAAPPPASPTLAAVPAGLAATAGSGLVTLSWSASSGATSYNVLRATQHGGPYTQVASPTSPTYADGAVANGTAYYYVVAAVDAAGTSANSTEVSATPAAASGTPAVPAGSPPAAGYVLKFDDEFTSFNGNANGTNGWKTQYNFGRTNNAPLEAEYYSDSLKGTQPVLDRERNAADQRHNRRLHGGQCPRPAL